MENLLSKDKFIGLLTIEWMRRNHTEEIKSTNQKT
jgi:hypothetical protein